MMNNIKLFPIPEESWWRNPEEKKLTTLPKQSWKFNVEKEKKGWEEKDLAWAWFGLVDNPEIHLFISESTGIIAFESSQEDDILLLLLQSFFTSEEILFDIEIPKDIWDLEYIGEDKVCNRSQRELSPDSDIIYDWINVRDENFAQLLITKFTEEGEKENIVSRSGTYIYTYLPTGFSIKFDIEIFSEYSVRIAVGIPEKSNLNCPAYLIKKKLSLIEILTIPSTILWKKLINSSLKKQ